MKILFHLGHPAHFHLFKNLIYSLKKSWNTTYILIKKKDVLEELLQASGQAYFNILPAGRKDSKLGIGIGQLKQDLRMFSFCLKHRPDILIGTSVAISHVGKFLRIPSINVNEDDAEVVPLYSNLAYPWANIILSPISCDNSKWEEKSVKYQGYHELAYLHPNNFTPEQQIVEKYISIDKPYSILRFAKLKAHHDKGISGISLTIAKKIISICEPNINVYITSERKLEPELEPYRIKIEPIDMHHVMAFAKMYIGDSQTMAAEAAVLGIPFIRFNDFVDRIGYLNEIEKKYKLGYGIPSNEPKKLYKTLEDLLKIVDLKSLYQQRRKKMLDDKIDVTKFLVWFIENYPKSIEIINKDPEYQYKFKINTK